MATKDSQIRAQVKHLLDKEPDLLDAEISVVVEDGVVTLGGYVENPEQKKRAEAMARNVGGVDDVVNSLRVGPGQRGAGRWWDALRGEEYEEAHRKIEKGLKDE